MGAFNSCIWYLLQIVEPSGSERAIMIADNLLYVAIFVFIIMFIGLVLTFMEFRYGKPKQQQERAEKNPDSAGGDMPAR
ncbi:MAG: uncharacterized membrane protein YhaH (DUF805 family) [Polaribacter sp.]|jgi:uncharacterized membrane protein YhaH (DUF805 family)